MELISEAPADETLDHVKEPSQSLEDAIEDIGFGKFHVILTIGAAFLLASDIMQLVANAVLSPILLCEWDLSKFEEAMITTVTYSGQGIGSVIWGYLSDRYGRKMMLCASALTTFVFGVVSSQVLVYWAMLVCRFLVGIGMGGGTPLAVAILAETFPIQQRSGSVLLMNAFGGLGSIFATALALAVVNTLNWHYYLLILPTPILIFLLGSWWMPESPRYLLITKQMGKLNRLLERIAKVNGKNLPEKVDLEVTVPSRGRILDLFTEKFRATTAYLFFMWFTTSFCVVGIELLTTQIFQSGINGCQPQISVNLTKSAEGCRRLTNTDYKHLMITSCSTFPSILIVVLLVDRIGRRICLTIHYGLGFLSIAALLFCSSRSTLVLFIFIFRGAVISSYATLALYTAEVFPTNVRSVGLGCCSSITKIGSMITPFVAQVLIYQSFYFVLAVYALPLALSVISSILLKTETNQKPLEDSSAVILKDSAENYQTFQ